MAITITGHFAISDASLSIMRVCLDDLTENLPNLPVPEPQAREDGPSAMSPALPSPDKQELKRRLKASEATVQAQSLENSSLKKDNDSLVLQVADMGSRLQTLETLLKSERELTSLERKQGWVRLRDHHEASTRALAKQEVSKIQC